MSISAPLSLLYMFDRTCSGRDERTGYNERQTGCQSLLHSRSYICLTERVQEGMRELDTMKDKQDVNLYSTLALIYV